MIGWAGHWTSPQLRSNLQWNRWRCAWLRMCTQFNGWLTTQMRATTWRHLYWQFTALLTRTWAKKFGKRSPPKVSLRVSPRVHQETFWLLNCLSEPWNTILGSLKACLGSLRTLRLAKTVRGFLMYLQVSTWCRRGCQSAKSADAICWCSSPSLLWTLRRNTHLWYLPMCAVYVWDL
jgi:hypothetical protein